MPCPPRFPVPYFSAGLARAVSAPRRDSLASADGRGGLLAESIRFESRSGDGYLIGWSAIDDGAWDPLNPSAWPYQRQKWRGAAQTGGLSHAIHSGVGVACAKPETDRYDFVFLGLGSIAGAYADEGGLTTQLISNGTPGPVIGNSPLRDFSEMPQLYNFTRTPTALIIQGKSQCIDTNGDDVWDLGQGNAAFILSTPDSVHDALTRAGRPVGTLRETSPGETWDTTSPESLAPISFTGATSVRAFATFRGLAVGASYNLRAWSSLRGLDGQPSTTTAESVTVTPAASDVELSYDVPVRPGYAGSLIHIDLVEA